MIPIEISLPSPHVENFNPTENDDCFRANLDLLEITREQVQIRMAAYHQKIKWCYDSKGKVLPTRKSSTLEGKGITARSNRQAHSKLGKSLLDH